MDADLSEKSRVSRIFWVSIIATAAFSFNAYRALTQAITYDEAFTWEWFLDGSLSRLFAGYNANNHVLFNVLAWTSSNLLGVSAFSLRLPTVIASVPFALITVALCRRICGRGPGYVAAAAVLLNPLALDFMSAARGYGLALALFTGALYAAATASSLRGWMIAGLCAGLAVAANLTFAFPVSGLGAAALALDAVTPAGSLYLRTVPRRLAAFGAFAALTAAALLIVPLSHAERTQFFFGADNWPHAVESMVEASIRHDEPPPDGATETAPATRTTAVLTRLAVIPCAVFMAGYWIIAGASKPPAQSLIAWTFLGTLASLTFAHHAAGIPYPIERTGLYLIPLFVGSVCVTSNALNTTGVLRRVGSAGLLIAMVLLAARSAQQIQVSYYYSWKFDAGSRRILDVIARDWRVRNRPNRVEARVAVQPQFAPALEFYRRTGGYSDVGPFRETFDVTQGDSDYFVLSQGPEVERARAVAVPIFVDPVSDAVVLVASRTSR